MMTAERVVATHTVAGLLREFEDVRVAGEIGVNGLATDSRKVQAGDLFLAVAGSQTHGLQHARQAIALGAAAVAWEPVEGDAGLAETAALLTVPAVAVPNLGQRVGLIADRFYGHPSRGMFTIGVTGTDGKTSCSHFIAQALDTHDRRCGVIGTLGASLDENVTQGGNTTPDAVSLQRQLAGCSGRATGGRGVRP